MSIIELISITIVTYIIGMIIGYAVVYILIKTDL